MSKNLTANSFHHEFRYQLEMNLHFLEINVILFFNFDCKYRSIFLKKTYVYDHTYCTL